MDCPIKYAANFIHSGSYKYISGAAGRKYLVLSLYNPL